MVFFFFFFFQAEDGIRDGTVTGVQTCALPISDLVWIFLVHAREREFGEALRGFCVESASGRIRRGGVRRFGRESHRRNEQEHKQKIFHFSTPFCWWGETLSSQSMPI